MVLRIRPFGPANDLVYFLLTGLIIVLPALMNQSPLVYSDSGAFIDRSFSLEAMTDRPIGYCLIMRAVTWQATMWTVVFFQGLLTSWLLYEVLLQLMPRYRPLWRIHLVLLGVLVLTSSLPWYASQIMPDALTALLAPILFLLFFGKDIGRVKLAFLWVCLFFIGISHFSHLAMLMAITLCLFVVRFTGSGQALGRAFWKNWSALVVTVAGSVFFIQTYNASYGYGRVMAPATDLFLAAKLCESGVMYTHLKRCCPEHDHPLCQHFDQLNATAMFFIWDDNSPLMDHKDQVAASRAIAPLVHEVLSDPANWPMIAWTTFTATLIQLAQVEIGAGIMPYGENSSPWYHYKAHLYHELPLYMNSLQQRGQWHFEMVNNVSHVALLLSLILLVLLWSARPIRQKCFMMIALGTVFFNAMATGGLANVYDRLQARVTWLIVLCACIALFHHFRNHRILRAARQ